MRFIALVGFIGGVVTMHIIAKIRKTGEQVTLRSFGFGYIDARGRFFHKTAVSVLEVVSG